jgi:hypothetical protein
LSKSAHRHSICGGCPSGCPALPQRGRDIHIATSHVLFLREIGGHLKVEHGKVLGRIGFFAARQVGTCDLDLCIGIVLDERRREQFEKVPGDVELIRA